MASVTEVTGERPEADSLKVAFSVDARRRSASTWIRWCVAAWRRRSTGCWMKRLIVCARRVDTSEAQIGRTPERAAIRGKLATKAGEVTLKVPRLRKLPLETAIIERSRRRESSVEEALVEMYLAGVSVRRVEDITEALWGTRVSPSTVSELNQRIYAQIEVWRKRRIEGDHAYVYLDGIWLKRSWGAIRN